MWLVVGSPPGSQSRRGFLLARPQRGGNMAPMTTDGDRLVELLRAARRTLVFSGAGISTGSGIPDFRGPEGVWRKHQPVYYHDFMRSEEARTKHWDFKLEGWPAFKA